MRSSRMRADRTEDPRCKSRNRHILGPRRIARRRGSCKPSRCPGTSRRAPCRRTHLNPFLLRPLPHRLRSQRWCHRSRYRPMQNRRRQSRQPTPTRQQRPRCLPANRCRRSPRRRQRRRRRPPRRRTSCRRRSPRPPQPRDQIQPRRLSHMQWQGRASRRRWHRAGASQPPWASWSAPSSSPERASEGREFLRLFPTCRNEGRRLGTNRDVTAQRLRSQSSRHRSRGQPRGPSRAPRARPAAAGRDGRLPPTR